MKYLNLIFIALGTAISMLLILTLPCLLVLPLPQRQRNFIINPLWKIFGLLEIHCLLRTRPFIRDLRTEEEKKQRVPEGLYVSNHLGMVDIPLILSVFQAPPIMKKEVMKIPIFGVIGVASGAIPLNRKDSDARKKVLMMAQTRLLSGNGMQVYPEGTRSKTGRPKAYNEISPALIKFCYEQNIPVYPVSLWGTNQVFSAKGEYQSGKKIGMIIHPRMTKEKFPSADAFAVATWELIVSGHDQLENELT